MGGGFGFGRLCEYPGLPFQRCPVRACSLVSSLLLNGATMSQQSSLTQSAHSVRQVLTAYTRIYSCFQPRHISWRLLPAVAGMLPQFIDEDPRVLAVVYGDRDQLHAALLKSPLQRPAPAPRRSRPGSLPRDERARTRRNPGFRTSCRNRQSRRSPASSGSCRRRRPAGPAPQDQAASALLFPAPAHSS